MGLKLAPGVPSTKSEAPFPPAPFTCCETLRTLGSFSQHPSLYDGVGDEYDSSQRSHKDSLSYFMAHRKQCALEEARHASFSFMHTSGQFQAPVAYTRRS